MTPERKVKEQVARILREEQAYYLFPATHGYGRSGVPDIIACVCGQFVAIECKAGKNKPTALQVREIESIRRHGGRAMVVNEHNIDMVRHVIRSIKGLEGAEQ
ncbi:MAG: VRR-NUC domain-containing protein [Thermoflexales bacterium]